MTTTLVRREWSQQDLDRVEEMKLEGFTNLQIAKELGRSESAINTLCWKKHFRRCLLTPKIYLKVIQDNPGCTNAEIGKMVGVKPETVKKARQRLRAIGFDV
jgi:DNA-binding CsgD family transcriptional regulator